RGRGNRLSGRGFLLFEHRPLFFEADLLFQGALQLVGRPLELGEALAQGTAQLRQLARTKNDQSDHENDDQLRHANGTKHKTPAFCKGRAPATNVNYSKESAARK